LIWVETIAFPERGDAAGGAVDTGLGAGRMLADGNVHGPEPLGDGSG
jgi:hypothetical protein